MRICRPVDPYPIWDIDLFTYIRWNPLNEEYGTAGNHLLGVQAYREDVELR